MVSLIPQYQYRGLSSSHPMKPSLCAILYCLPSAEQHLFFSESPSCHHGEQGQAGPHGCNGAAARAWRFRGGQMKTERLYRGERAATSLPSYLATASAQETSREQLGRPEEAREARKKTRRGVGHRIHNVWTPDACPESDTQTQNGPLCMESLGPQR